MPDEGRTIETEWLTLRPFREADLPAYTAIRRKPGVTRFLPSHSDDPDARAARAEKTLRLFISRRDEYGYGPWAVIDRESGALVGHLGLNPVPEEGGQTELLYLLDPDVQGKGLATEAGREALGYGFDELGLDRIVAWAMPENVKSWAVMERLGMLRTPDLVTVFGIEAVEYSVERWAWG